MPVQSVSPIQATRMRECNAQDDVVHRLSRTMVHRCKSRRLKGLRVLSEKRGRVQLGGNGKLGKRRACQRSVLKEKRDSYWSGNVCGFSLTSPSDWVDDCFIRDDGWRIRRCFRIQFGLRHGVDGTMAVHARKFSVWPIAVTSMAMLPAWRPVMINDKR